MATEEDLLGDTSFKEYGDLEDLDADAEEALLGVGSDDELQDNEVYEGQEDSGEEVEYVDEEGNPVEIAEGDEVEFVEYTDSGQDTETYEAADSVAEDVLDIVVDADLEFDDSVVQEESKYEPPSKKPKPPMSARLGQSVQTVIVPKEESHQDEPRDEHVDAENVDVDQSVNAEPSHGEDSNVDNDDDDQPLEEIAEKSASESEDEEEDEEDEASGRGRFHSERPNIIQLSTAKKRTNIPDTLDGIVQNNDSFRPDFRDKRNRPNWEHFRQEQQQQQQHQQQQYNRNRDSRGRGDRERSGPWPAHGNRPSSQATPQGSSRQDPSSSSKNLHNNQSKEPSSSTAIVQAHVPSLLGEPPNLVARAAPPPRLDSKESQGSRKILINPHFKGSVSSSSSTSSTTSISRTSRATPLLESPAPSFQQPQVANFAAPCDPQRASLELHFLMAGQRQHQQQKQQPFHPQFNSAQQSEQRPSLAATATHYEGHPVSSFRQHDSTLVQFPYSTPSVMSSSAQSIAPPPPTSSHPLPPPPQQYAPLHQQQQLHRPNDPWHQNVPLLQLPRQNEPPHPTHMQTEVQQQGAWGNPPHPIPQYAVASVPNAVPHHWPQPPQQSQTMQSVYAPPMEHHQHQQFQQQQQQQQLTGISFLDMRQPPPNYNGPRMTSSPRSNVASWQDQMQRPRHHLQGVPLSPARFNLPPRPMLTNASPPNSRFIVPATSPLKQLSPRLPFNNKNSANDNNLRPRLPTAGFMGGLLPQPQRTTLWPPPGMPIVGDNLRFQFNRKRPLNQGVNVLRKVTKPPLAHQQAISRRQFQVISNIKEVQLVDTLPPPMTPAAKIPPKSAAVPPDDEDEETRQYRKQIELQKKKREEILRIKEQRRVLMALQRRKQMVEQQKLEGNVGNDVPVNAILNLQPMIVPQQKLMMQQNKAITTKIKPSSALPGNQSSPLLMRTTGQPIMSLVSRVKKQVVVRRVPPLATGQVLSPKYFVQQPGFFHQISQQQQQRSMARAIQTKIPNFAPQVAPPQTLMQKVMPLKQALAQYSKGVDLKSNVSTHAMSKAKQTFQQPVGGPPRRVVNAVGVAQASNSPNIVSKKFPAQSVNVADPLKNALLQRHKQQQQNQLHQQQSAMVRQNAQQRAAIAGQQTKRTVVMNSADVKLVQQKQQPVAAIVAQQAQRRVLPMKVVATRVQIDNLALSTSEAEVHKLCQNVGPVEDVVLHRDRRTAIVTFRNQQHAHEFMSKYQRRMLDLSLINISIVT